MEEPQDLESSWRGLGIGRLLVLAVVVALLVSAAGLWMLKAEFTKRPEQSAQRLASPAVAAPEPESRSAEAPAKNPPALEATTPLPADPASEGPQAQEPKAEASVKPSAEPAISSRPFEIPAQENAQQEVALEKAEAKGTEPIIPSELMKHAPDTAPSEKAQPIPDQTRVAAIEKPQAQEPAELSSKEAAQLAKAELPPPPLVKASISSPAGFTFKDCDFCPELVVVPKGEFLMGSNEHPNEKPAHKVRISYPFAIGQYEVTYAEWTQCVQAGGCRYRPEGHDFPREAVGNLSWEDASAYLKWLSEMTAQTYRLPTEAEWEYAARAGTSKRFWWGDAAGSAKANCSDCGSGTNGQPSAAGSYKPNPFSLYDTAGNMAEWVEDCWNDSYRGAPVDGSAWLKGNCGLRGLRGGSYGSKAAYIRSSARFRYDSDVRYEANGFRALRELR